MDINTERAKELAEYVAAHPEQEEKEIREPVFLGGKNQYLKVYRIPIKLLIFNIRNGRFASELLSKERELCHPLDATKSEDASILMEILLNQKPDETEVLKESIREHGQLHPGLVTFDGAVINANRRMAVISKLHEETGKEQFEYLKAAMLPKGVGAKELWRIEAGLQFAKDLRLEYGPVNELLKLREGIKHNLTPTEISNTLEGRFTAKDVENRLKILDLIDSYLKSIGKENEYMSFQAERVVEQFNSLQDNVLIPLRRKLGEKEGNKAALEVIPLAFRLIDSQQVDYRDIRKLKGIMLNSNAKKVILTDFNPTDTKVNTLFRLSEKFNVAEEMVEATNDHGRPKLLVEKALAMIGGIDSAQVVAQGEEMLELLQKLKDKVEELLSIKVEKKH